MDFNYHISIMAINAATYQITITTYQYTTHTKNRECRRNTSDREMGRHQPSILWKCTTGKNGKCTASGKNGNSSEVLSINRKAIGLLPK